MLNLKKLKIKVKWVEPDWTRIGPPTQTLSWVESGQVGKVGKRVESGWVLTDQISGWVEFKKTSDLGFKLS